MSYKCTFCGLLIKSSFLSKKQGCGEASRMSFPSWSFSQLTPQFRLNCTGAPSLAQETLPVKATSLKRTTGISVPLARGFPPFNRRVVGHLQAKWISVSHSPLSSTSLFYDMPHMKTQRENVNLAIGKCVINLMDKCICHHQGGMTLPLSELFCDLH